MIDYLEQLKINNMELTLFNNRRLVIATMHRKETVIAPPLEQAIGVKCLVLENFDSDELGTFSGEVERLKGPLETAREKCLSAMRIAGCDLGVASEGSFGVHPTYGFLPSNDELIIFIDQKNDLEIIARNLTTETNFMGTFVSDQSSLLNFAEKANFPSHALILRNDENGTARIKKGIQNKVELLREFNELHRLFGKAFVETDMRAMNNPTRMRAIEKTTEKLIEKILFTCPSCETPGFEVSRVNNGLKCSACGFPTRSTLSITRTCKKCGLEKVEMYPNQKEEEDPTYCDICNP